MFRLEAPGGAHLIVRRHGSPELALWLPGEFTPRPGEPFGFYLHPDRHQAARMRAASLFRRAIGLGPPIRARRHPHAHRLAAMLCIHDLAQSGLGLRAIAEELAVPVGGEWGTSSERNDLRRLAEAAASMIAGGFRSLLHVSLAPPRGKP